MSFEITNELKEEVLKFVETFDLNAEGYFTEDDVDYFLSKIDENSTEKDYNLDYSYETGASKCVIIPENKDYVIKIPFNGRCIYNWYDEMEEEEEEKYTGYEDFTGTEGVCNNYDYCSKEVDLFYEVKYDYPDYPEFKDFLLPIKEITRVNDYPIYVQPKATLFYASGINVSEESVKTVSSNTINISAPIKWLAKCLEDLGNDLDLYEQFVQMLSDTGIKRDLHSGNVGIYNNHAVIIDYAGFND